MGAAASSTNSTEIANNTSVNYSANCAASQVTDVTNGPVDLTNMDCGSLVVNVTNSSQALSCSFNTSISASAKATADQQASSQASNPQACGGNMDIETGVSTGCVPIALDWSSSASNNVVQLQNEIEMQMNLSCNAAQTTNIHNRFIKIDGAVVPGACAFNSTGKQQNASCVFDTSMQLSESGSSTQTASSSDTNSSTDTMMFIAFGILAVLMLWFLGKGIWRVVTAPVSAAEASVAGAASASSTAATAASSVARLKAQIAAKQAAIAAAASAASAAAPAAPARAAVAAVLPPAAAVAAPVRVPAPAPAPAPAPLPAATAPAPAPAPAVAPTPSPLPPAATP